MFYRRKIILSLFELFEGELEKIRLQKLLFLVSQRQAKSEYDFIPYKFGCYSYSANADLGAMVKAGLLSESNSSFQNNGKTNYFATLKESDKKIVLEVKNLYGKMNSNALMKHTYINYPYYAINSITAKNLLNESQLNAVSESKSKEESTVLFTIGYEGISLEEYLNRLLKNNITLLVDVRNNPLSMKYGFSKSLLSKFCENLGIQYVHLPEVGVQSEQRQELNTQADYDKLFVNYRKTTLAKTRGTQEEILSLLRRHKRIALTCFEANICQCHRKPLADAIKALPGFNYELKHI